MSWTAHCSVDVQIIFLDLTIVPLLTALKTYRIYVDGYNKNTNHNKK
jgi:hypothetical protein